MKKRNKLQKIVSNFKKIAKKLKKIDLLNGKKKWEIMFRKIFFLLSMALLIYFLLLVFVGKKGEPEKVVSCAKEPEVFMSTEETKEKQENEQKIERIRNHFEERDSELADYAEDFVSVANKYGIDYRLLPAIATYESDAGNSNFKPYNPFGWGNKGFGSYSEAIEVVGKGLAGYYAKGLDTVAEIAPVYCPPNSKNWEKNIKSIMSNL
jgi:hypothetical protein